MSGSGNGFISTDVTGMAQAQQVMQEIYGELNSAVQMLGEQQATLASNWSGEAQTAFGQALENYMNDFNKINSALVGMLETMSQNTNIYVNTNDTSTSLATTFMNSTSGGGLVGF
jgi:WXG100 family type VII secretion target